MPLKTSLIQLVSHPDPQANISAIAGLLERAVHAGSDVAVLPENAFCYGASPESILDHQGRLYEQLAIWAKEHKLWLIGGSLPWMDPNFADKPSASCFVFSPRGEEVLHYRKCHLFDADVADAQGAYRESDHYSAGKTPGVFDTPWGKMGVGICYDLRFPEYFRLLSSAGARAVFLPSAFTYLTGQAHWEVLVRARAIENQVFLFAANQGGDHSSSRRTWGDTMAVDPWGQILARYPSGEGLITVEIDLEKQNEVRQKMPVLNHRRF